MKSKNTIETITYKIFADMDGVLTNFDKGVTRILKFIHGADCPDYNEDEFERNKDYRTLMWNTVWEYQTKHQGEMWYELMPLDDAEILWEYITRHHVEILTATGPPEYGAGEQKHRWVADVMCSSVKVNLTRKAAEKAKYAASNHILIDDKEKAINPWREAGGVGILHTSAASTINQLKHLGL